MTKEALTKKIKESGQDCDSCEFKVVPDTIEPCKSCCREKINGWTDKDARLKK